MGDLKVCLPHQNGPFGGLSATKLSRQPPFPVAGWWPAEQITQRILRLVRPTISSEVTRKCVVEYVQKLIKTRLGAEVFPFGSVPLKTYLPDGDIDLTVIGASNDENLASRVHAVLEEEEKRNMHADFEVKDVQYINAEVKLVKCLIDNIMVDISFSQIGGIRTLCFLEQVDIFIGKDNLFKRSIILIKSWCYYESRLLGAHHALISTYALEVMVVYIFHLFHSSLDGPFSVLYRFLEYFSKFDWDKYCISLRGPVHVSFLPDIVAEPPDNDGADLLFPAEFLRTCGERVSVPPRASEDNHRLLVKKYLNIIDPLKENNNLGRSVSRGNFYRIRSAFAYGARKLSGILVLSGKNVEDELNKFFANTIERHAGGEMPDLQHLQCYTPFSFMDVSNVLEEISTGQNERDTMSIPTSMNNFNGRSYEGSNIMRHLDSRKQNGCGTEPGIQSNCYLAGNHPHSYANYANQGLAPLAAQDQIDKNHLADGKSLSSTSIDEVPNPSPEKNGVSGTSNKVQYTSSFKSYSRNDLYRPHAFPFNNFANGHISTPCLYRFESSCNRVQESYPSSKQTSPPIRSNGGTTIPGQVADASSYSSQTNMGPQFSWAGELVGLSGDDSGHRKNLVYAQWCHDHTLKGIPPRNCSTQFNSENSGDTVWQPNMVLHTSGIIPYPPFSSDTNYHPINFCRLPQSNGMDAVAKTRGTGTFIPIVNQVAQRERPNERGQNQPTCSLPMGYFSHSPVSVFPADMGGHKAPPLNISINGSGNSHLLEIPQAPSSALPNASTKSNGLGSPHAQIEFGTYKSTPVAVPVPILMPMGTSNLEAFRTLEPNGVHDRTSSPMNHTNSDTESKLQTFHLKNNEDFPPLAGQSLNMMMHWNSQKTAWETKSFRY